MTALRKRLNHISQLALTAYETGHLRRQVVADRIQRAKRGKVGRQAVDAKLKDAVGQSQVAEAVLTQIQQAGFGRQVVAHQLLRRLAEQRLPTVAAGQQPAQPVQPNAEVVAVARHGLSSVQRAAHPQGTVQWPALGEKCLLCARRSRHGQRCRSEGGTEGVAGRAKYLAAVGVDGRAQDRIMARNGRMHRLRLLFPEERAAFDVGIQKRNGAGG